MSLHDKFISKIESDGHITIDFVGDSITYGLNHCNADETYVAVFAKMLSERLNDCAVYRYDGIVSGELEPMKCFDGPIEVCAGNCGRIDVIRNGVGGNTVMRALNRIDDFTGILANGKKPDITFFMFGINDALDTDPLKYVDADTYKKHYKMLINETKLRNPDTDIVIMSLTFNGPGLKKYRDKSYEVAYECGLPFIDLFELWMNNYDESKPNFGQDNWLAGGYDACHPTSISARITAEYIFKKICDLYL